MRLGILLLISVWHYNNNQLDIIGPMEPVHGRWLIMKLLIIRYALFPTWLFTPTNIIMISELGIFIDNSEIML